MPIDAGIPLSAIGRGPTVDPFQVAQSLSGMQVQQQNAAALQEQREAIAEQRKAQAEAAAQALADRNATGEAIRRGAGVRDETLAWARQNAPNTVPSLTKFFDEAEEKSASIKKLHNELNNARLDHLGHLADGVLSHAQNPEMLTAGLQTALALYKEQFPDEAGDVDKIAQQLQSAPPDQVKGYLEQQREAAPFYQAKQAKNTPQVIAPGGVLVDDTGKELYKAPAKEEHSTAYKEWQDVNADRASRGLPSVSFEKYQDEDANRRRSIVNVNGQGGPDDVKEAVAGMKDGTIPPQLPGRASKEYTAMMAEAHRQGYDLNRAAQDYQATQKHFATLNGAQQTRIRQAVDTAYHSLDVIDELAEKWNGGRYPLLNAASLKLAKSGAFGKDAQSIATQLDAQISDLTSELGNVYMGGNSPTDHALALAAKNLSGNWPKDVLRDMTKLARTNLRMRQNAISNIEAITPSSVGAGKASGAADLVYDPKTGKFTKPGGVQ